MFAVALAALALTGTPAQHARLHDLVGNVRSFDGLAPQIWGLQAYTGGKNLNAALVTLDHAKTSKAIAAQALVVQKQGNRYRLVLSNLPPVNQAMADDALHSLTTNLKLIKTVVAQILAHG